MRILGLLVFMFFMLGNTDAHHLITTNNGIKEENGLSILTNEGDDTKTFQSSSLPNNNKSYQDTGWYRNPLLAGDYPDPSILRVGKDYYMTHSSFVYYPGLRIWHSTDMVNWEPIGFALHQNVGSVYAPDFVYYDDKYFIYFPAGGTNWVVTAQNPAGPWSDPINLKIGGIDPGHVVMDGERFLYMAGGKMARLTDDGLSVRGEVFKIYDGWDIPDSLNVECKCLEGPKSTIRNGYFYMISAEGGTAGPSTSHMVIAARSKSVLGPWENSPYNPIIHTSSKNEKWWSQGHGSLIEDSEGNWWMIYHAYEKDFRTLGRQTLMMPIEWTSDGWFKIAGDVAPDQQLKSPYGSNQSNEISLSDDFSGNKLGLQWQFFKENAPDRVSFEQNSLLLKGVHKKSLAESNPLLCISKDNSYQVEVEMTLDKNTSGGLTLFYNEMGNVGVAVDAENFYVIRNEKKMRVAVNDIGKHVYLKIENIENEIFFYFSENGQKWIRLDKSVEVSGFNHNTLGGFLSLRAGLFALGDGAIKFKNFRYTKR